VDFVDNHYFQALRYIDEAYGLDYLGEKLGVAYADDFMGQLIRTTTIRCSTACGAAIPSCRAGP
jgi:hypothetical protein